MDRLFECALGFRGVGVFAFLFVCLFTLCVFYFVFFGGDVCFYVCI